MDRQEGLKNVIAALHNAQKGVLGVQTALTNANPLAPQIPMYGKLGKIVSELQTMTTEAQRLPL